MDGAIQEELRLGELMRNDILRELDVIQTISSSLLVLDLKRNHIESHFESLVKMIERKRDEAIEAIRVREEKRFEELRMKEVQIERLRKGVFGEIFVRSRGIDEEMERMESFEKRLKVWEEEIDQRVKEIEVREKENEERCVKVKFREKAIEGRSVEVEITEKEIHMRGAEVEVREKEFERRAAEWEVREKEIHRRGAEIEAREKEIERRILEWEVKEKEMDELKKYVDRLCMGLTRKEREISGLKKVVDELKLEVEKRDAECRKLADKNHGLQEEVKVLTEKFEVKQKVPEREEQLKAIHQFLHVLTSAGIISICNPVKDLELNGQELFITVRDSVNNEGAATSKVSSLLFEAKDKASALVVEALKMSYLSESKEKNNMSLLTPCRILMLELLGHICPEQKSQVRNEALKVAGEWKSQIESRELKPVEISRFLQFLSLYDIAPEFSDEDLIPMLHCVAVYEGTPDFCFTVGLSNRITEYIKTMIKNKQQLKALEYVTTFKMAKEFSVVEIIQAHLKDLRNNCQKMLNEGVNRKAAEVQVLDFEITTLKELIECINVLKLQSIYTTENLEERLANLEKQKYQNKRPAACTEPINDLEPPRKKGYNHPLTVKSPEPNPSISNIHPEVGSRELTCFGQNGDPLANNIWKFPDMAKSKELIPQASDAYLEVRSGDWLRSNHNGHIEPSQKKECELPGTQFKPQCDTEPFSKGYNPNGTAKVTQATSTTPNVHPKIESRKVLGLKPNNSNPEPLRNIGCTLPRPLKPHDMSPKGTMNAYPEIGARNLLSSNGDSCLQPQRKNECQLPGQTNLMEVARNTSNGPRDIFYPKPESYLEPVRNKIHELPGTAKLREVVLNGNSAYPKSIPKDDAPCSKPDINPVPWTTKTCNFHEVSKPQVTAQIGTQNSYTESGLRDALHSQEMQNASFRFAAPPGYPFNNVSSKPPGYQPPLSTRPPQYYRPCPPLEANLRPQVPSWNHSVPNKTPCFDFRR